MDASPNLSIFAALGKARSIGEVPKPVATAGMAARTVQIIRIAAIQAQSVE